MEKKGKKKRKLETQGGREIELVREYGVCPKCGQGIFPLDEELQLLPGKHTPCAHERLVRLAGWIPSFESAAELLEDFLGIEVGKITSQRYTEEAGAAYEQIQNEEVAFLERHMPEAGCGGQKTRGRFYLFLSYDAVSGKVHWMFLPGKSAYYVNQFMRRIRYWYPHATLWVALDQDRAHPCKSHKTRQTMRDLQLHWISLPKGSPDDNPVETIFSDIQLMILDNSNDTDSKVAQHRIGAHLRGRNPRADPRIRVPYLHPKHSHTN